MALFKIYNKGSDQKIIASGDQESGNLRVKDWMPVSVLLPVTDGSVFTFLGTMADSPTDSDFYEIRDLDDLPVTLTKTPGQAAMYALHRDILSGFSHIRIKSDTIETADRTVIVSGGKA